MRFLNNEGSQLSKFHFPCNNEEKLVFISFFREFEPLFQKTLNLFQVVYHQVSYLLHLLIRDHSHITGKSRGSAHRDCNINVTLNHKVPTVFHNLKNYDSHLIQTDINVSGLEKYVSLNNNKLILFDCLQLSSSLDNLVKVKYLSQQCDNKQRIRFS